MISLRLAEERGKTLIDWLESYHTFSFDQYYDPKHAHFRSLRVINEDMVKPGQGFHPHSHRDMEIITYVLKGALEHKDSLGNGSMIRPGDVQRMSAGTGVTHSEFNPSKTEEVHLLQIWILPEQKGLEPGYEQKNFKTKIGKNSLFLIASPKGDDGLVKIHQDVKLFSGLLDSKTQTEYKLGQGRYAWVQVARGKINLNGATMKAGDGAAISDEQSLAISATNESEILLFDLA